VFHKFVGFSSVIQAKLAIAGASRNPGNLGVLDSRVRGNDDRDAEDLFIEILRQDTR